MDSGAQTSCWSPGDIALITNGEFAGMAARIWSADPVANTAVVSLRDFRTRTSFQLALSSLRKLPPSRPRITKAGRFGLTALCSGPLLFAAELAVADYMQGRPLTQFPSVDLLAFALSWPLYVSAFFAAVVWVAVMNEPEYTEPAPPAQAVASDPAR
jgi:hypothetical protein